MIKSCSECVNCDVKITAEPCCSCIHNRYVMVEPQIDHFEIKENNDG